MYGFKHIIILNVIILVKDNILYIVLLNASLYFNIGKYNVLYVIQTLNQISLWRIQFTDWNENKKDTCIIYTITTQIRSRVNISKHKGWHETHLPMGSLAVDIAKGTQYSVSCHDHNLN